MEKTDLLVIVPHEDDELAIAGATIYGAIKQNMAVKVVFTTNGDYYAHEGSIRIREAKKALAVLGVAEENIIFLGYGDQTQTKHLYNSAPDEVIASYNGNTETYGTDQTPDFAWKEYGCHHTYTRNHMKSDIRAVLEIFRPSIIITTDWDHHMDHLALSLLLDETLGDMLREDAGYQPLLLKSLAYNGKWEGNSDYYSRENITQSVNQADGVEHVHALDKWEERIRFSVPEECRTMRIKKNILYKAAREYRSQSVDLKAPQFINLDMVYWRRPTESLTYRAEIETSSGMAQYLNDFKCADCSDIINGMWNYDQSIWIPDKNDTEQKIEVTLEKTAQVREIHLFENPDAESKILDMVIIMDGEYEFHTGELHHDGSRTIIAVPEIRPVQKLQLKIVRYAGEKAGLTEIEIYENIHNLNDYKLPLSLWSGAGNEMDKTGSHFGIRSEQLWFRFLTFGRVRLWPDKYFLMKRYRGLKETDNIIIFWKAYLRFVWEKLQEKKHR